MTNTGQRIDAIFKRLQTEEFEPLREFLKSQLDAEFSSLKIVVEPSDFYRIQGMIRGLEMLLGKVTKKRG